MTDQTKTMEKIKWRKEYNDYSEFSSGFAQTLEQIPGTLN